MAIWEKFFQKFIWNWNRQISLLFYRENQFWCLSEIDLKIFLKRFYAIKFMLIDRLHFTWVNSLTNFMFQMNFDRHINLSIHLLSSQNSSEKPEKILCAFLNQFTNKNSLMDPNHYSGSILSQIYLKYSGFQYMESWCFRWYLRRKKRKKFK